MIAPLHTLLVPLDGSTLAEQALVPAIAIARASGATLHVTEVFLRYAMDVGAFATAQMHFDLEKQLEQEARLYLEGVARDACDKLGAPVQSHLVRAAPLHSPFAATEAVVHGLGRLVRRLHADLVVMATHARGGLSRGWLGSIADALVRRGTAPMLLVHPRMTPDNSAERFNHVLVPLDGSERAEEALPLAFALASLSGGRVTLIQVVLSGRVRVPRTPVSRVDVAQVERDETIAAVYLNMMRGRYAESGVEIDTATVVDEHPARAILDYAEQQSVDLIAISTRGRGSVKRFMLGSVADKVLRGSAVPVLLTKPREHEAKRARQ